MVIYELSTSLFNLHDPIACANESPIHFHSPVDFTFLLLCCVCRRNNNHTARSQLWRYIGLCQSRWCNECGRGSAGQAEIEVRFSFSFFLSIRCKNWIPLSWRVQTHVNQQCSFATCLQVRLPVGFSQHVFQVRTTNSKSSSLTAQAARFHYDCTFSFIVLNSVHAILRQSSKRCPNVRRPDLTICICSPCACVQRQ